MAFTLNSVPGFSDLDNAVLSQDKPALGVHVAAISQNAALGMDRLEFFQGLYQHGDHVILPTSLVDGYPYVREELVYSWTTANSANPSTRWITGPDCLWYLNSKVEQSDGLVNSEEWYRRSGHHDNAAHSNDGRLMVTTIAQRQRTNLTITTDNSYGTGGYGGGGFGGVSPTFQGDQSASIATDKPWKTGLATALNVGAKFAVIKCEAMYMGEFTHGQTVPQPISPADDFTYPYANTIVIPSWRWTTVGGALTQPDKGLGQLQRLQMSVSSVGVVSLRVDYQAGDVPADATTTTHGRIAVVALGHRPLA